MLTLSARPSVEERLAGPGPPPGPFYWVAIKRRLVKPSSSVSGCPSAVI